jgi:putative transposase
MSEKFPWRTGRSCVFKNSLHLVFVTKYRRKAITDKMLYRLKELFNETCKQMDAELLEFNGEDDHVHLLVSCPPKLAVANLVQKLKGKSAYFLRKEFWTEIKEKLWGRHFWSPSYCVVSCGGAPLETVRQYIEDQRRPPTEKQIERSKRFSGKTRDSDQMWK